MENVFQNKVVLSESVQEIREIKGGEGRENLGDSKLFTSQNF